MQTSAQQQPRYTTIKLSGTSGHHIHKITKLLKEHGYISETKPKWNRYPETEHGHIYTVYLKVPISDTQTLIEQVVEAIC